MGRAGAEDTECNESHLILHAGAFAPQSSIGYQGLRCRRLTGGAGKAHREDAEKPEKDVLVGQRVRLTAEVERARRIRGPDPSSLEGWSPVLSLPRQRAPLRNRSTVLPGNVSWEPRDR